eukprot:3715057-Alexandrium_andersonii.AAC.1
MTACNETLAAPIVSFNDAPRQAPGFVQHFDKRSRSCAEGARALPCRGPSVESLPLSSTECSELCGR